jgi:uncharacterized MAPEG superfamily protein
MKYQFALYNFFVSLIIIFIAAVVIWLLAWHVPFMKCVQAATIVYIISRMFYKTFFVLDRYKHRLDSQNEKGKR